MRKQTVHSDKAPAAIGPYSQAVKANGFVFVSGQIPINPATGQLVKGDIRAQTRQSLENVREILNVSHSSLESVVKATIFLTDINDYAAVNGIYAEFFGESKPARAAVEVTRLPKDANIEIEVIALAK